jgi:hypothetical protein
MFVDISKGVQYLNEIKDSVVAAMQWATKARVLGHTRQAGWLMRRHGCWQLGAAIAEAVDSWLLAVGCRTPS